MLARSCLIVARGCLKRPPTIERGPPIKYANPCDTSIDAFAAEPDAGTAGAHHRGKLCSAGNFPPTYLSQTRNLKQAWKLRLIMKTEADDDGAVSVDFFFPVKFCFIPAGSVKFFPGISGKRNHGVDSRHGNCNY